MFMMCVCLFGLHLQLHIHLCSVDGMVLAGEARSARRKPCLSGTLSTTNFIWIGLGMNTGLRRKVPTTDRLSLHTNVKIWNSIRNAVKCIS